MSEQQNESIKQPAAPYKEETVFSACEKGMAVFTAVFSLLFMHFAVFNTTGIAATLMFAAIITAGIIFMRKNGCIFTKINIAAGAVLYIFSLVFTVTANSFIKFLDMIFMVIVGAYFVYSTTEGRKKLGRFLPCDIVKAMVEYPFTHMTKEYGAINSALKINKTGSSVKYIVIGLITAVPLTLVVGVLLMSADDGMYRILSGIFSRDIRKLIPEILLSVPASMWLFGMFYANTHKSAADLLDEERTEAQLDSARRINNIIIYTSVTPVCFLYVIFFISQFSYFMSAFSGNLPDGYSYAEYARKGFFELCAIVVINSGVITLMNIFAKNSGRNKPRLLKTYTVMLSVFTMLISVTAISKMVMYIDMYGLTQDRVYTSWFMVLTFLMFIPVIIAQFIGGFRPAPVMAVIFTVMFGILCFSRPDALIARNNLGRIFNEKSISSSDIDVLWELSDDAKVYLYDERYYDKLRDIMGGNMNGQWTSHENALKENLKNNPYAKTNISGFILSRRL